MYFYFIYLPGEETGLQDLWFCLFPRLVNVKTGYQKLGVWTEMVRRHLSLVTFSSYFCSEEGKVVLILFLHIIYFSKGTYLSPPFIDSLQSISKYLFIYFRVSGIPWINRMVWTKYVLLILLCEYNWTSVENSKRANQENFAYRKFKLYPVHTVKALKIFSVVSNVNLYFEKITIVILYRMVWWELKKRFPP